MNHIRHAALTVGPLLAALLSALPSIQAAERPPNFVLIFADDQGYNDLGCYGAQVIRTPRIDRMAKEGLRFLSFYAQPICGPSRAALMTGCYPLRVAEKGNVKNVHPVLHSKEITVAEVLKQKDYATGCFGKWDLAGHSNTGYVPSLLPLGQGFDTHFGTPSSNDSRKNTRLMRDGKVIEHPTDFSQLTRRYTDEAIQFIQRNEERPFFAYIPHTMPHTELDASEQFKGKSRRGLYGDVIEEIDFSVGRILDELKRLDLVDNTYVIYTSDNGPWLIKNKNFQQGVAPRDHGGSAEPLRSGKVSTWEGGVRVPAIVWAPGRVPGGGVSYEVASTMDILPTFAELAGCETPDDRVIDGKSLAKLFHGEREDDLNRRYYYYFLTHLQAVREGQWKLHLPRPKLPLWQAPFAPNRHIHPKDDIGMDEPMLFEMEWGFDERVNVAKDHPEVVKRLLAIAEEARADIGDHDRVGRNMRFFDPMNGRPTAPKRNFGLRKPRRKK